jgi:hypothetical protein
VTTRTFSLACTHAKSDIQSRVCLSNPTSAGLKFSVQAPNELNFSRLHITSLLPTPTAARTFYATSIRDNSSQCAFHRTECELLLSPCKFHRYGKPCPTPHTYMMIHKANFKLESLTLRGMKLLLARQSERDYLVFTTCNYCSFKSIVLTLHRTCAELDHCSAH